MADQQSKEKVEPKKTSTELETANLAHIFQYYGDSSPSPFKDADLMLMDHDRLI